MSTIRWRKAKEPRRCNVFSQVWGAILGCTGSGTSYYSNPGLYGRQEYTFACPVCRASKDRMSAMGHAEHQAELMRLQRAAGIRDYRTVEVVVRGGRPVLTGRIDVHAAREEVEDELRRYTRPSDADRVAVVLAEYVEAGGDPRLLVADARLGPTLLAALREAYRRAARGASKARSKPPSSRSGKKRPRRRS